MNRMNTKGLLGQWLRRVGVLSALGASVMFSAAFGTGCESSVGSYCVARCDCQGCSQQEREDCNDDVEDSLRLAEHDDCTSEFNDYLSCYSGEGSCTNGAWIAATCTSKGTLLRNCSSRSATFVKTACQEDYEKRQSCGVGGGGVVPCAGQEECAANCALAAPCSELADVTENSTYANCVNACWSSSSSSGGTGAGP